MPQLLVFAGPNGSGKSTITGSVKIVGEYINADDIKSQLNCSDISAAEISEASREFLLNNKKSFTFETVLSTHRNIDLMERAKRLGYRVVCIYVLTKNPEINIARIKNRVQKGGHDVPNDKVKKRFCNALRLFPKLLRVCDELYVYDNSIDTPEGTGSLIVEFSENRIAVFPNEIWNSSMIKSLIVGDYPDEYLNKNEQYL